MNNLLWLLNWFNNECDGDWEHGNGFQIGTLDNPGCYLKISIEETELQKKNFELVDINRTDTDWIYCIVEEGLFKGYGGILNLPEILQIFRNWAESKKIEV